MSGEECEADRGQEENDEDFVEVKRENSPTNPFPHKSTIQVKMRQVDGETHVLCLSSERREKDRAIHEAHEKRLLMDLVPYTPRR